MSTCEHWCHIIDDVVHAGTYSNGQMHTFTVKDDGKVSCRGVSLDVMMSLQHAWRDRKLFGLPVCSDCEVEVSESASEFEEAILGGYLDFDMNDVELLD